MENEHPAHPVYKFKSETVEFHYDSGSRRLMKGATRIKLERIPREVLAYLVEHPKRLIPYAELKSEVWKSARVEDGTVYTAINKIRRALREAQEPEPQGADFIETARGEGVEFRADVAKVSSGPAPPLPVPVESESNRTSEAATHETLLSKNDISEPRTDLNDSKLEGTAATLNVVGDSLMFRVDWPAPPFTTATLHVSQPLFERFLGVRFYRGKVRSDCPQFFALLLDGPGIASAMVDSPYEVLMGRSQFAEYDDVAEFIRVALRTATGMRQVSYANASEKDTPAAPSQRPVDAANTYTDGDWITAGIVARERAETELKKVASRVSKEALNIDVSGRIGVGERLTEPEVRLKKRAMIDDLLQTRVQELLGKHSQGGTTDDTRLEACIAKVVADILDGEIGEFGWAADERSGDDPVLVFRDTIKTIATRYR